MEKCVGEKRNTAAVFDLDGTLFTGHFWNGVVKHHIKHRVKIPQLSLYLVTHMPLWLLSKFRVLSEETCRMKWGEDLAVMFKGFSRGEGLNVFRWISNNYVMKLIRSDVVALLQQHKNQGHVIILLSGSFSDFLGTIKESLFADYIVGTKLEIINGIYSGRIVKPSCLGKNKARLLKEFITQAELDIDLDLSFAYADSIFDAPVLEMVGNPVATYPERELLKLAQRRGWQILPHIRL
jgi:HAD superfamily hydrolase (TIGR01490 family)